MMKGSKKISNLIALKSTIFAIFKIFTEFPVFTKFKIYLHYY